MKMIPLTMGLHAIVDDEDYKNLVQFKWVTISSGYSGRYEHYKNETTIHLMHRQIMKCPDGMVIDHKNGNKLDNLKNNLRVCTRSQNQSNRKISTRNKSGFKGVSWQGRDNKWLSLIIVNKKRKQIGLFDCKIEAAKAYNLAAEKYFGEFALFNEIPKDYM